MGSAPSDDMEAVPNLINLTYSQARLKLNPSALYVKASGAIINPNSVYVTTQSIPAGTMVKHGTVIDVSVEDTSDLGRY